MRDGHARALWTEGAGRLRGFAKPIAIAWFLNVALAIVASLSVHEALDAALSHSRWATLAARRFDLDWFYDFRAAASDAFAAASLQVWAAGAIVLLLTVFLSGGVLGRLRARDEITAASFFADCARYFIRFFELFALALGLSGLLVWLFIQKRPAAFDLWLQFQPSDFVAVGVELLLWAALVWLLAWVHMAQDLARLALVVRGRRTPLAEFVRGLSLAARHFDTLAGLYLWTLVGFGVMTVGYLIVSRLLHQVPGGWGTLALLVLAQLFMLARIWLGFGLTASVLTWYERTIAKGE